jgi:BirA family transcriptional regulator, biotin operon repressor / biotin---[acetyl-CoA-carboxylase] ligase
LEIFWFDTLPSTQTYLVEKIKNGELSAPVCIIADTQSDGQGSRANKWEFTQDSLLFSFAVSLKALPDDLKLESASIYFMYILKELLANKGSNCWLKWPNDIYIGDKKMAGAITSFLKEKDTLVCGIGINFSQTKEFGGCDIKTDKKNLINEYLSVFTAPPEWKHIFRKFEVEFLKTREKMLLHSSQKYHENVTLNSDGSLSVDNKKVFSLR